MRCGFCAQMRSYYVYWIHNASPRAQCVQGVCIAIANERMVTIIMQKQTEKLDTLKFRQSHRRTNARIWRYRVMASELIHNKS